MANEFRYTAVFEPAEEGGYIAHLPAIPGLATQGETMEEARAMAADCLRAYRSRCAKTANRCPGASGGPDYRKADRRTRERMTGSALGQRHAADPGITASRFVHHVTGSHYVLKHSDRPAMRIVVPHHGSADVKRGILRSILRQAGLTADELLRLL